MFDKDIIFNKSNDTLSSFNFTTQLDEDSILNNLPVSLLRKDLDYIKDIAENEVVRHFINLSNQNFGVDTGFYPLGSCTMKYNPKINEKIAAFDAFKNMHPYSDVGRVQGNLQIMNKLKKDLLEISGMNDLTLAPCAGAHGEITGLFIIKKYFEAKGDKREYVLIPDSAHGTNPASASMAGFKVITINSDENGFVDINDLKEKINDNIAAFMLTNPNTLGLYEKNINEIAQLCHEKDIQLYFDGANLNALLGISRPGDSGFDVVHMNFHKTFSTPHGGGGPGAGAVCVKSHLSAFLPNEDITIDGGKYSFKKRGDKSIGRIRSFVSSFSVILKTYIYINKLGNEGLRKSGLLSILNANYLAALLKDNFNISTKDHVMHEFVMDLTDICEENHISIMDFAKRILDYGYHSPTVSFPLIVHNCLMIEPTETERKETLDKFAEMLIKIAKEAKSSPENLKNSPTTTPIARADEVKAARNPILKYLNETPSKEV